MISGSSSRLRKLGNISENDGRILRSKADAIRQRIPDFGFAGDKWHVIEITLGIGILEIESRRNQTFSHRKQNRTDACRAACTLRMSDHRFGRTHRDSKSMFLEAMFHGTCLDTIVQLRRRAVQIHVINVVDRQARILDCEFHRSSWLNSGFVETNAMMRITCRSISEDFGINPSTSSQRRTFGLDDIQPRAFSKYEAVTVF